MLKALPLLLSLLAGGAVAEPTKPLPPVEVFTPTVCLTCIEWAEHLRQNGFTVKVTPMADMDAVKRRLKVPQDMESVPSALVAGYFVEGHVPAEDIKLLLAEKPAALGLAVPGLPQGAPGREFSNPTCETACTMLDKEGAEPPVRREFFETFLVDRKGKASRFARH
ncbi:MAG: metal-binding protein [Gammaproteobacteria bacterium]|nr:metal-binding protein [Gammaproteobacteria bacterium]MBU1601751.1 metal-binding protein [Gammaproteobacteria bacterium]MBU2432123.1 metal-binding protein [Gammaproteobacteria bacterium]MBU2450484.1 metal-binding protein [Gammaproteobacteria bacterium]